MAEKNVEGIKKHLHPDVEFFGPLSTFKGKVAVSESVAGFMKVFKSLEIQTAFGADDQAAVVYLVKFQDIPDMPSIAWLQFKDGLITRIQLFFDASPFRQK
jgi:hypothetical protein